MTDIQAAVGREQLKRLPEIVAQRRATGGALRASCSRTSPACELPARAGLGALQLAELLRAAARRAATSAA